MRIHQGAKMPAPTIGARDLLLLLIGLDDTSNLGLGGLTRIQKLVYLLETEENIQPSGEGFEFEPYKAGPYSSRIYDDLEFLENLGFISRSEPRDSSQKSTESSQPGNAEEVEMSRDSAEASEPEKAEVDLTFEELMGPEDVLSAGSEEISPTADSYEEARFRLTEKGKDAMERLLQAPSHRPFIDGIRKAKSRFLKYSLNDLLYYVYTRHPEMTTESEIKEKVLRRRPA